LNYSQTLPTPITVKTTHTTGKNGTNSQIIARTKQINISKNVATLPTKIIPNLDIAPIKRDNILSKNPEFADICLKGEKNVRKSDPIEKKSIVFLKYPKDPLMNIRHPIVYHQFIKLASIILIIITYQSGFFYKIIQSNQVFRLLRQVSSRQV
jgi:hypothetical protein